MNDLALDYLKGNPDVKIIGIDRGERNLLYLVLMDQHGRILEQKSFNTVSGVDYHAKLDLREKERDNARKSWSEIGQIKDLKAGYLSGIIHEIARMMVSHNAIAVLEDLNGGFKRSRTKIEKQVYQKFEHALINKLNYLIFKDSANPQKPGGVLKGYQLTPKLDSFAAIGKQCGFLFYIPAWCTSNIDPVTGFVNLFGSEWLQWKNIAQTRKFFAEFDAIRYNSADDLFEFDFDYRNFTAKGEGSQTRWTVCSVGERIESFRNPEKLNRWDCRTISLTAAFKDLFKRNGIDILGDLAAQIQAADERQEFWRELHHLFKLTVQLRNSRPGSSSRADDYILSPVRDRNGVFFDSRQASPDWPCDADANGAFNIARKGLWILQQLNSQPAGEKKLPDMNQKDWLNFVQKR